MLTSEQLLRLAAVQPRARLARSVAVVPRDAETRGYARVAALKASHRGHSDAVVQRAVRLAVRLAEQAAIRAATVVEREVKPRREAKPRPEGYGMQSWAREWLKDEPVERRQKWTPEERQIKAFAWLFLTEKPRKPRRWVAHGGSWLRRKRGGAKANRSPKAIGGLACCVCGWTQSVPAGRLQAAQARHQGNCPTYATRR